MRYFSEAGTLRLDPGRCTGCGRCVEACPHAVFALAGRAATLVDPGACMECGACARNCEPGAIAVTAGVGCAAALTAAAVGIRGGPSVKGAPPACRCG